MDPEAHVIKEAAKAAKAGFAFLSEVRYEAIVPDDQPSPDAMPPSQPDQPAAERTAFLESWIKLEEAIHQLVRVFGDQPERYEPPLGVLERVRALRLLPEGTGPMLLEAPKKALYAFSFTHRGHAASELAMCETRSSTAGSSKRRTGCPR
ncbi:MAG: hypothetical protein GX446_00760 [Chthonomonadales bacterium]|nr:hypothetical protein [Chthonomonadales bacterium]